MCYMVLFVISRMPVLMVIAYPAHRGTRERVALYFYLKPSTNR